MGQQQVSKLVRIALEAPAHGCFVYLFSESHKLADSWIGLKIGVGRANKRSCGVGSVREGCFRMSVEQCGEFNIFRRMYCRLDIP